MRRATFISLTFHAAIAAAIAAGMMNAKELPELDGGILVSLVAAAPGTLELGDPGSGSPQPPAPAARAAAAHTLPRRMPTPPTPADTAETAQVPFRPNPPEPAQTVELPPEEPVDPPPPEIEPAEAPPPEPVVTPAKPESSVEPTPVEPTPVEVAVSPEAIGTAQATSATTDDKADGVQVAHADAGPDGVSTDDSFSLGSMGVGTAADPAVAADYAALLAQWLEHHKEYPERARRRHQQGVVLCEFTITDTGDVMNYRILEGSGHVLLDEEVVALIARASPLPPPPPGAAATYRVPIIFALR
jgi:protein TonB